MSVRLLKKVLNEQKGNQQEEGRENQLLDGEESESPESVSRPSINLFDLLNEDSESEIDAEGDMISKIEVPNVYKDEEEKSRSKDTAMVSGLRQKSKKKKKKKKDKEGNDKTDEDLDSILENISLDATISGDSKLPAKVNAANLQDHNSADRQGTEYVLQSHPKYLNAENELRRIFGSKVVKSFENSNQTGSSRQVRGGRRGNHNLRKTVLVMPLNHWPRWDGSLSMEFLQTKGGYNYFRYVRSSSYAQAEAAFEAAKTINDINGLASILLHHPYHLDTLLAMAEYFKVVGEHQMSADAVSKCLYALECAWHPMFTPLRGNYRLKFRHDTNRPMFSALFTHMKNLDRRGCHRSALEVCKLLLSLDSDDPMGAIFCIDYFSLRAGEYAWLERFSEEYTGCHSLWFFPNFSYSLAICRFYLEREASKDAYLDSEKASSIELMKQALLLHPPVIKKLVAKVPLKDKVWTNIIKHTIFRSDQTKSPSQNHLINIYVERNYLIWRLSDLQKLLSDAAQLVMKTLDDGNGDLENWICVRKEAFSSDKNEYAHLLVSDFSDSVATIPHENLQHFMGDPRMMEVAQNENQAINPRENGHAPRAVANRSPLAVLFESMLPWVTYGDAEEGEPHND